MAETLSPKKPLYKKWWFGPMIVIILIAAAGAGAGSDNNDSDLEAAKTETQQADNKVTETKKERSVTGEATTLGAGTFLVGTDIKPGLYDVAASNGESGNFITSGGGNEILGGEYGVPKLRITLSEDEEVKISGLSRVSFTPVTTAFVTKHASTTLHTGTFIVGEDIGAGRYRATPATGESGNFITSGGINEILGGEYGVPNASVNLREGEEIKISGMDSVKFTAL